MWGKGSRLLKESSGPLWGTLCPVGCPPSSRGMPSSGISTSLAVHAGKAQIPLLWQLLPGRQRPHSNVWMAPVTRPGPRTAPLLFWLCSLLPELSAGLEASALITRPVLHPKCCDLDCSIWDILPCFPFSTSGHHLGICTLVSGSLAGRQRQAACLLSHSCLSWSSFFFLFFPTAQL